LAALAAVAMATLVSSQLALMSVLDAERAEDAAATVAQSRFTGDLIERTVRGAVDPVLDESSATFVAVSTSQDPRVRELVRTSLVTAHQQVVDPDASPVDASSDATVRTAIVEAVTEAGAQTGVDVSTVTGALEAPSVLPEEVPSFGLRPFAENVRLLAALVVLLASLAVLAFHPRPGRGVAGLGWKFGIVFGAWFAALLVVGWIVGAVAETLFGELLDSIWSDAVPAMLLLCGAGLLLSVGLWFGGVALDGLTARRGVPAPPAHAADGTWWG
jgi:hypothetical protein